MAAGPVVPTFRKPRKVGQPRSWRRTGGPTARGFLVGQAFIALGCGDQVDGETGVE
jgi:hypothetical protein